MTTTTAAILCAAMLAQPATTESAADRLHGLFAERHAWEMREFPERAMSRGDYSRADRVTDTSLAAIERRHAETTAFLERLAAIDRARLSEQDLVSCELFELELANEIKGHRFRTFLMPVGGRFGPQTRIAQMHERVRFETTEDYLNYMKRLRQAPRLVENAIEQMTIGLAEGRTPARATLDGLPGQFRAIREQGLEELFTPLRKMPAGISEQQQREILTQFHAEVMPLVEQAIERLERFVVDEYMPRCRQTVAAADLPDGREFYDHQLRVFTTTAMTAGAIHEVGRREVARIRAETMDVIRRSDFLSLTPQAGSLDDAALFKAFVQYLRTDPRFYHTDEEALLEGYRSICKRVDPWLAKLFVTLPRLPYGVKPVPKFMAPTQTTAYYQRGDIRNAEPGWFVANTYALDQRPKYEMIPLTLHEAVPGHHLQVSLAQEMEGLPEFRKDAYFVAFGEGWALYAERLGIDMGLYSDPYDDFGRLLYEMWRACRLVVDTGMHAMGWSRRQAIDFMLENTALSRLNIENEVDRYINWPGQACAYKIGELKIRELRERAEKSLGAGFDLRGFHEVVLGAGAVPLPVLERRVNWWIDRQRGTYD